MKRLFAILFFMSFFFVSQCTSGNGRVLESVSIIYDRGNFFRIVSLKSNDFVRWSKNAEEHYLSQMELHNADSLYLFKKFLESMQPDTSVWIRSVLNQTVIPIDEGLEISFYDDKNDIEADAMIIFHYKESSYDNDTLFMDYTSGHKFRINNYRAKGDTLLWKQVVSILQPKD